MKPTRLSIPVCAWCNRWQRGGEWEARSLDDTFPAQVSHTICPDCAARLLADAEDPGRDEADVDDLLARPGDGDDRPGRP
jgi:hypothetical protein